MELGGSVEERMAYLCGLGYRHRRTGNKRHIRKGTWDEVEEEHDSEASLDDHASTRLGRVATHAPVVGVPKTRSARTVLPR